MYRIALLFVAAFGAAVLPVSAADFSLEEAAAPGADALPSGLTEMLSEKGVVVKGPDGKTAAEVWGRSTPYEGDPAGGFGIRYDTIPEGALIGVIHFPDGGSDFREQSIPAGWYTMRYSLHPEDGNHMGVAPSRDFVALTPAAEDAEPAKNYPFAELVEFTKKVGNPHPTVMRLVLPEGDEAPHLWVNDFEHTVLDFNAAGEVIGLVVHGHSEE